MQHGAENRKIRRVVTGHDAQGRSVIVQDRISPFVLQTSAAGGPVVTDLWKTFGTPADNSVETEPCSTVVLAPAQNGTTFRTVQFPPDASYMDGWNEQGAFAEMGHKLENTGRHSKTTGMHRTRSLDYALVLSGEIWAVMDEGETLLREGDVLIQRGTNHGWSNRSSQPALVAFVLIDAKELASLPEGQSS